MAFNPDAYLAKTANSGLPPVALADKSQGFDPDSYLAKTKQISQESPTKRDNSTMAALEGFGSEATAGYLPQLQAAVEPLQAKIMDLFTGGDVSKDLGDYASRRDENIQRNQELEASNPYAYGSGRLAGGIASSVGAGGVAGKGLKAAGLINAPGTALSRVALAGGTGGARGLLMNPGDTKGEVKGLSDIQMNERLSNAKEQGLLGAVFQGGGEGLGLAAKGARKGVDAVRGFAENRAAKALGPMYRDIRQMGKRGADAVFDEAGNVVTPRVLGTREVGREVLDSGILKGDTSFGALAEKAGRVKKEAGKRIGSTIDRIDADSKIFNQSQDALAQDSAQLFGPEAIKAAEKLGVKTIKVSEDLRANLKAMKEIPGGEKLNKNLKKFIQEWETGKDPVLGFKEAETLKQEVGRRINWNRLPTDKIKPGEERLRALYSSLRKGVEDGLDEAAEKAATYGDDVKSAFKKDKKTFGIMSDAEQIASRQEERQLANRFLSPSDYASGIGGGILGMQSGQDIESTLKGAAGGLLLNRAGRLLTNPKGAIVADKLAGLLEKGASPILNNRVTQGASKSPIAAGLLGGGLLGDKANQKKKK